MQVRKIRLTIEYDPDWSNIPYNQLPVMIAQERENWINGHVDVQDLDQSGTEYSFTIEVVP